MTLIVLTVLVAAWLGYFAMWFRDRRESRAARSDGMIDTSQYLDLPFGSYRSARSVQAGAVQVGVVQVGVGGTGAVGAASQRNLADKNLVDKRQRSFDDTGTRSVVDLLEAPRTPQQALRRRRHIAAWLVGVALLSLMFVPSLGTTALAMHVIVDVVLILFLFGMAQRQQAETGNLAEVRVLYPNHPVFGNVVDMPQRRVVNG